MKIIPKRLLGLAIIAALSPALITTSYAQLHLEIAKAPESAPKIAIIPFSNDQSIALATLKYTDHTEIDFWEMIQAIIVNFI